MKRFIRYLYEYEQGKRMRNVGFVKVDQDEEACIIHIHGKGLRLEGEKELAVYLFLEQDRECVGLPQGVIENVNPAVNYQLRFTKEDVGDPDNYAYIQGIIMENKSHRKYAAVWDDMPVNVDAMRLWTPPRERDVEKMDIGECQKKQEPCEQQELEKSECPIQNQEEKEQESTCQHSGRRYTKMQRQELATLPRSEWKLSNNSFLLHGYYNYHHLLFIEEDENCWLGIPGIYHKKEEKVAESFGFPQFIRWKDVEISLTEKEQSEEEEFGYWCRHIRR